MESHKQSMAECHRQTETDSDDTVATCSTVFVDTSLHTHLAIVVSNYDTISDLKRKITLEHLKCFPRIGEIKIQALKVKRKGNFYHLSDSMLVSSAFEVGKRNWFVSVDAYGLKQQNLDKNSSRSEASNPLALICFKPNPSGELSLQRLVNTQCTDQKLPDAEHSSPRKSKDIISEDVAQKRSNINVHKKYEVITTGAKVTSTNQKNDNLQSWESTRVKKKRKIKKQHDEVDHGHANIVGITNSLAAGGREVSCDAEFKRKDVNEEDSRSGSVANKKRKIEITESSGNPSEINTAEKKMKRRRKKAKHEPLVQVVERICNENVEINNEDFGNEKHSELVQEVVEKNNVTCQSIGTDMHEVDSVKGKGNRNLPEVDGELNDSSKRKKKRAKKVTLRKQEFPGIEEANDAVGETSLPVVHLGTDDHHNDETMKDKSMSSQSESKEISEQRPIDDSSSDVVKGDNKIESEAERVPQGNTDVENKKPADSANVLESEGAIESLVKVVGTKKKVKKVKKSAQTAPASVINGHSSDLMKKGESFLSRIEKEASSQQKPIDRDHENLNESAAVGKLEESARPNREMEPKKNKRKPAAPSAGTSSELQNKEKLKDEDYNLMPPPKKSLEVSARSNETRKNQTGVDKYKGPAKNSEEVDAVRKVSSEAKNGSQLEKSSLPTPSAIFSDDRSDSCIDEKKNINSNINSDTSTRAPSDNSSSSGSSKDSLRNGSSSPDRKEGRKNITKTQSAGPKNITMDMIFRSSSRFKKAKLIALGDGESQSVDFVPDSQPNL